jgi:hypothetical protein
MLTEWIALSFEKKHETSTQMYCFTLTLQEVISILSPKIASMKDLKKWKKVMNERM